MFSTRAIVRTHLLYGCAGTVVNPIRVEARKRRSPEINWYLLKSNFLTVMAPNSLMEVASSFNDSSLKLLWVETGLFQSLLSQAHILPTTLSAFLSFTDLISFSGSLIMRITLFLALVFLLPLP
jgi:hypothetical protein